MVQCSRPPNFYALLSLKTVIPVDLDYIKQNKVETSRGNFPNVNTQAQFWRKRLPHPLAWRLRCTHTHECNKVYPLKPKPNATNQMLPWILQNTALILIKWCKYDIYITQILWNIMVSYHSWFFSLHMALSSHHRANDSEYKLLANQYHRWTQDVSSNQQGHNIHQAPVEVQIAATTMHHIKTTIMQSSLHINQLT